MRSSKLSAFAFLALLALLILGVFELLMLRFETGDVYSPYSSLRSDPLGAKAYYEGLQLQPELQVERRYRPVRKADYSGTALFYLGCAAGAREFRSERLRSPLESVATSGGRLIVGFLPVEPRVIKKEVPARPGAPPKPNDSSAKKDEEEEKEPRIEPWGVTIERLTVTEEPDEDSPLPRATSLYFSNLSPEWTVVRRLEGRPSIIERKLGKGTLVLVADSYPLSNEGLREARDASLLATLPASFSRIVFDEAHLGTVESGSVMLLARRYHLQGLGAALLLLLGLFLWRNMTSFLPAPAAARTEGELAAGHSAATGLAYLLRRSVPVSNLLSVCESEWKRSLPLDSRLRRDRADRVTTALDGMRDLPIKEQSPVRAYLEAARILSGKG